jgi:hypothetical protein
MLFAWIRTLNLIPSCQMLHHLCYLRQPCLGFITQGLSLIYISGHDEKKFLESCSRNSVGRIDNLMTGSLFSSVMAVMLSQLDQTFELSSQLKCRDCLLMCLFVCLSVFLPVCLGNCLYSCLSVVLPVCLPACLSSFLSVFSCLSVVLPVCLPTCLSSCLSV